MSAYKSYDPNNLTVLIHQYLKMEQSIRNKLTDKLTEHYAPGLAFELNTTMQNELNSSFNGYLFSETNSLYGFVLTL